MLPKTFQFSHCNFSRFIKIYELYPAEPLTLMGRGQCIVLVSAMVFRLASSPLNITRA